MNQVLLPTIQAEDRKILSSWTERSATALVESKVTGSSVAGFAELNESLLNAVLQSEFEVLG